MTKKQYDELKVGDNVCLPFSVNTKQVVHEIDRFDDTITTHPADDRHILYVNDYSSVEFVSHKQEKTPSKEKEQILAMFSKFKCETCPFHDECNNTYDEIRAHTTNAFTICDALHKHEVDL